MIVKLGRIFDLEIDLERKVLIVNTRGSESYVIEIPIEKAFKISKVTWNKKAGETLKDVAKKKPTKELLFDSSSEKVIVSEGGD